MSKTKPIDVVMWAVVENGVIPTVDGATKIYLGYHSARLHCSPFQDIRRVRITDVPQRAKRPAKKRV